MRNLASNEDPQTLWSITPYFTKQKERRLNELGEIEESPDSVAEPFGWTQDAKMQLAVQVVSREVGRPMKEVSQQLELLKSLLPDLETHVAALKAADLVRLSCDLEATAEKLLVLREALPAANISRIVAGNLPLLGLDKTHLKSNLHEVASMLAPYALPVHWQSLLEQAPFLVDPSQLRATLSEIERLFGSRSAADTATLLIRSPELALSCQDLQPQGGNDHD